MSKRTLICVASIVFLLINLVFNIALAKVNKTDVKGSNERQLYLENLIKGRIYETPETYNVLKNYLLKGENIRSFREFLYDEKLQSDLTDFSVRANKARYKKYIINELGIPSFLKAGKKIFELDTGIYIPDTTDSFIEYLLSLLSIKGKAPVPGGLINQFLTPYPWAISEKAQKFLSEQKKVSHSDLDTLSRSVVVSFNDEKKLKFFENYLSRCLRIYPSIDLQSLKSDPWVRIAVIENKLKKISDQNKKIYGKKLPIVGKKKKELEKFLRIEYSKLMRYLTAELEEYQLSIESKMISQNNREWQLRKTDETISIINIYMTWGALISRGVSLAKPELGVSMYRWVQAVGMCSFAVANPNAITIANAVGGGLNLISAFFQKNNINDQNFQKIIKRLDFIGEGIVTIHDQLVMLQRGQNIILRSVSIINDQISVLEAEIAQISVDIKMFNRKLRIIDNKLNDIKYTVVTDAKKKHKQDKYSLHQDFITVQRALLDPNNKGEVNSLTLKNKIKSALEICLDHALIDSKDPLNTGIGIDIPLNNDNFFYLRNIYKIYDNNFPVDYLNRLISGNLGISPSIIINYIKPYTNIHCPNIYMDGGYTTLLLLEKNNDLFLNEKTKNTLINTGIEIQNCSKIYAHPEVLRKSLNKYSDASKVFFDVLKKTCMKTEVLKKASLPPNYNPIPNTGEMVFATPYKSVKDIENVKPTTAIFDPSYDGKTLKKKGRGLGLFSPAEFPIKGKSIPKLKRSIFYFNDLMKQLAILDCPDKNIYPDLTKVKQNMFFQVSESNHFKKKSSKYEQISDKTYAPYGRIKDYHYNKDLFASPIFKFYFLIGDERNTGTTNNTAAFLEVKLEKPIKYATEKWLYSKTYDIDMNVKSTRDKAVENSVKRVESYPNDIFSIWNDELRDDVQSHIFAVQKIISKKFANKIPMDIEIKVDKGKIKFCKVTIIYGEYAYRRYDLPSILDRSNPSSNNNSYKIILRHRYTIYHKKDALGYTPNKKYFDEHLKLIKKRNAALVGAVAAELQEKFTDLNYAYNNLEASRLFLRSLYVQSGVMSDDPDIKKILCKIQKNIASLYSEKMLFTDIVGAMKLQKEFSSFINEIQDTNKEPTYLLNQAISEWEGVYKNKYSPIFYGGPKLKYFVETINKLK